MVMESTGGHEATEKAEPRGLTRPLFVVVGKKAISLPASASQDAFSLDRGALRLLDSLARGQGPIEDSAEGEASASLWSALEDRALVRRTAPPVGENAPEAPSWESEEIPREREFALVRPFVLTLDSGGFAYLGHDGRPLVRLTADELVAAHLWMRPRRVGGAFGAQESTLGADAMDRPAFDSLVRRLLGSGLLLDSEEATALEGRHLNEIREAMKTNRERRSIVKRSLEEAAEEERERVARTGVVRTRVVPVNKESWPVLSLGLVMSYAMDFEGGRLQENYEFLRDWGNVTIPSLEGDEPPAVFLFSNYIWSHRWNAAASAEAKAKNPGGICIHGGPDTPKYKADLARYLELNKHVDIVVHGEGEATLAEILDVLQESLAANAVDLSLLCDVKGLTYRIGDETFTTPPRPRLADVNVIPSPFTSGLFDSIGDLPISLQAIETNRGCPFGCTFCDWGTVTQSKIRKYDLERVYADIEWCAQRKVKVIFNTDSNFGLFERDVEIARKVVEMKERYGYPRVFESSYAKNRVKYLKEIIEILAGGGVVSTGTLSLQSVSPETLAAIRRSNIKVEKYDELAMEFSKAKLPLIVEMMMGLPGSTPESFERDLQQCIDREVQARVNPTEVLVNSPMNEPEYRDEHAIKTSMPIENGWKPAVQHQPIGKALIVSASTFTAEEYGAMDRGRQLFMLMENYGVLRQVARFVRHEKGIQEMAFYRGLDAAVHREPQRWPTVRFVVDSLPDLMVAPGSWQSYIDEIRDYLIEEVGIAADDALDTVLQVQHALLPARDRQFPLRLELKHDYTTWFHGVLRSKEQGWEKDWTPGVEHLRSFPPTTFEIDDVQQLSTIGMGTSMYADVDFDWEFASPVGRALRHRRAAKLN